MQGQFIKKCKVNLLTLHSSNKRLINSYRYLTNKTGSSSHTDEKIPQDSARY